MGRIAVEVCVCVCVEGVCLEKQRAARESGCPVLIIQYSCVAIG